ncbi:MAG: DUF433 domain-containing protein [Lewinellaceae bacterium]|nr:DUF433 domain-containing protein [Saprospiraceae bacterium]MCB9312651.1 DUF433 domain-containing protein [Lewinellaceae bacterium]
MIDWKDRIETNPGVLFGKPVVRGTRIPVDLILEKLSEGESMDDLMEAYPMLAKEDILAILAFASESIRNEVVHSIAP